VAFNAGLASKTNLANIKALKVQGQILYLVPVLAAFSSQGGHI